MWLRRTREKRRGGERPREREGLWELSNFDLSPRVGLILGGAAIYPATQHSDWGQQRRFPAASETWLSGSNWAGLLRGTAAPRSVPGPSSPQLGPSV